MELRTDVSYKKDIIGMSLGVILSVFFILFTNPNTMSIFWLLWLPVLVFISFYFLAKLGLKAFSRLEVNKIKQISIVLGVGPALVVVLSSLGSIGLLDIVLAVLLIAGFSWYLRRFQGSSDPTEF